MGTGRLAQSLVYMWTFVLYRSRVCGNYGWDGTNHPVGIPDRIVIYFPNRIVSWNNPQHLVKFQDRMVNPVHYMKFLKRFVFVSNDYETDVYVNHN